ncbi:2-C-methyl-D-erythritol 4-phosphate cytidylyltransferase [Candidatus Albibeggiatoa sp. nov. BB20]|uniref:2-C-methyl-D-erythritol 4-phosphate cytidylyltransferase n=1 Tax=Candidatus Albibeggiatoa sp. nov. BB20 TaxID=3162723 RepID=UPI0033656412
MNNYWAVVPAAGVGKRMGSDCPKQYLSLQAKPIIQHTLERLAATQVKGIVIALSATDPYWDELQLDLPVPLIRVEGGAERFHSVLNGLRHLQQHAQPDDWVLVHDAARPCVRVEDIQHLMHSLAEHPVGGLLALPVRDTMKRSDHDNVITETVSREQLWHALTPQMFRLQALTEALEAVLAQQKMVTDDAQAIELMGQQPVLIAGHADNIKVTHPQDLQLAALFLTQQAQHES